MQDVGFPDDITKYTKYTCSILWNNLDSTIKNSPSLDVFIKRDSKKFTCRFIQIINCLAPVSPFSVDCFVQIINCLVPVSPFSVDCFGLDHLTKLISKYTLLC